MRVLVALCVICVACTDSAVMCAACTDSAVTGRDACTGRFVRICVACTDSAVTWS